MLILAIDTTGFSASLALVRDGKHVLCNKIKSNFVPNKTWADFVEILPPRHQRFLLYNVDIVLKKNNVGWGDVDAVAVSANSGIHGCILVGRAVAETLASCHKKPLMEMDHIVAHTYSSWLERDPEQFDFPILIFSGSGSHSSFSLAESLKCQRMIHDHVPQQKRDGKKVFVGVGKIFYQAGKLFGLIAPDDPGVSKFIQAACRGNSNRFDFTSYYTGSLLDLDFTGFMESIKSFWGENKKQSDRFICDVAASFQKSVMEIIIAKILELAKIHGAREIHVVGGVSEDGYLRKALADRIKSDKLSFVFRYPRRKSFRLDNAAMVGAAAYYQKIYKTNILGFEPKITL